MNAIDFDKDGYARRLTNAGADQQLAVAIASVGDFMETSQLATKSDVKVMSADLRVEIAGVRNEMSHLRTELRGEMSDLRTELRGEMVDLRREMGGFRTELKGEMADLRTDLASQLGTFKSGLYGFLAAGALSLIGINIGAMFALARMFTS